MLALSLVQLLALADPAAPPAPAEDQCKPDAATVEHPCIDLEHKRLRFAPIYFDFDKSTIRVASRPALQELAALIRRHPELHRLDIRNHRDHDSSPPHSRELTQDRARAVLSFLIQQGVPPAQLTAQGYADSQPLVAGRSPLNRRTEILILDPPKPQ